MINGRFSFNLKRRYFSFNCNMCDDFNFCGGLCLKEIEHIKLDKDLKFGLLLYNETGITTETKIGRFVFKIKGGRMRNEKHAFKDGK